MNSYTQEYLTILTVYRNNTREGKRINSCRKIMQAVSLQSQITLI